MDPNSNHLVTPVIDTYPLYVMHMCSSWRYVPESQNEAGFQLKHFYNLWATSS